VGETTARATPLDTSTAETVVRPRQALVRSTAMSIVFSALPIAVAVVYVAVPTNRWLLVGMAAVLLGATVLAAFLRLRASVVAVHADRVTVRCAVTGSRTVPRSYVHEVVLVTTHGSVAERTSRELVALDLAGRALFRVRADVWGDDGVERLVDALDVRTTRLLRPMSKREFARRWPGVQTWFEQPLALVLLGGAAAATVGGLVVVETVGLAHR
jgi:hypothetical protein